MKIRLMRKNDIHVVTRLAGEAFSKAYHRHNTHKIGAMFHGKFDKPTYLVAEEDGKIVGFGGYILSWLSQSVYEFFWVSLDPKYQKDGTVTRIIKMLIAKIKRKHGATLMMLNTDRPGFYKRLGFKQTTVLKDRHFIMTLKLTS